MKKKIAIGVVGLGLAICWLIAFIIVNKNYPKPNIVEVGRGEKVTHKGIEYELLDVDVQKNFSDDLIADNLGENYLYTLTVKVKNTGEEQKIDLSEIELYRNDYSNGVVLEYFLDDNEDYSLYLEPGEEKIYRFPFVIYQNLFTDKQWKNIEKSDWKLLLNLYPDKIMIDL